MSGLKIQIWNMVFNAFEGPTAREACSQRRSHTGHRYGIESRNRPTAKKEDDWPVRLDLTRRIKEEFNRNGIEIPFPQRTVQSDILPTPLHSAPPKAVQEFLGNLKGIRGKLFMFPSIGSLPQDYQSLGSAGSPRDSTGFSATSRNFGPISSMTARGDRSILRLRISGRA